MQSRLPLDPELIAATMADFAPPAVCKQASGRFIALLDGGSGAGKTTLARDLVERLGRDHGLPMRLVSLDSCYPGWHGLAAGAAMIPGIVHGRPPGHPTWDWDHDRPAGFQPVPDADNLLIEGCGAITRDTMALADVGVWLELAADQRRDRALARDGQGYEPWWQTWADQEAVHWATDRPQALADLVIDANTVAGPDGQTTR